MNILITGGLGYIGGRLSDYFRTHSPEDHIFLADRVVDSIPEWAKKFSVLQMDLLDIDSIRACIRNDKFDLVIHLAALNEIESMKDPDLAYEVNTRGTLRLLEACRTNEIDKFIYFSTFHVYGKTDESVIRETTPTRPFHPYAFTHRAAEDCVEFFRHYHSIKTLIFRLSNGYGYPMGAEVNRWSLVFNDFCRQAVTTGKIVLKSSGRQYRDFISLADVSRAVYHFIHVKKNNWGDGLFNIGGDSSMTILDVAQLVSEVYKHKYKKELNKIEISSQTQDSSSLKSFHFSIEKLKQTGFQLKWNMEHEISRTLDTCQVFLKKKNK